MRVMNAGTASVISSQLIFFRVLIIRTPTKINAGAVAADGIVMASGEKNNIQSMRMATTTDVNPVLPPSAIPALLSIYVVTVDVPNIAPTDVPIASAR